MPMLAVDPLSRGHKSVPDDRTGMPQPKRPQLQRIPAPETQVYSNAVVATGGPFDIAIDFGVRAGDEPIQGVVRVTMSYEHLASMLSVLDGLLKQYTETFGELPNPDVPVITANAGGA